MLQALSVVLIVAAIQVAYQYATVRGAIQKSRALIATPAPYEQHPANPSLRVLVAGDSTGAGVGSAPEGSIAGRLGALLPEADITNHAESGSRLKDLNQVLEDIHEHYDLVLLQIGANDIIRATPLEEVRNEIRAALKHADRLGERTIIMTAGNVGLSPVFVWPFSAIVSARTKEVRTIFMQEAAAHGAVYVDLYKDRKDDVFITDVPRYFAPDRFHPSADGYGVWFEELKKKLNGQ